MKQFLIVFFFTLASNAYSQNTLKAFIKDASTNEPLTGATGVLQNTTIGASADLNGYIEIKNIPNGKQTIIYSFIGFMQRKDSLIFPLTQADTLTIFLESEARNLDEVTVSATRSSRSIDDIPMRIETITAGELEEKAVMQPGNIKMLLTESTGIQT